MIGTLGIGLHGALEPAANTTPDAAVFHETLARFRDQGAKAVSMEVSSIGLDQGRVNGGTLGPGRGIGLLFVTMGLLLVLITTIGSLHSPRLRQVEDELPDAVTGQPIHAEAGKGSLSPLPLPASE